MFTAKGGGGETVHQIITTTCWNKNTATISGKHTIDNKTQPQRALRAAQRFFVRDTDMRVGSDKRPGSSSLPRTPTLGCFAPVLQVKLEKAHEWRCASSNLANAAFHKCSCPSAAELMTKCRVVYHRCPVGSIIWTLLIPAMIRISTGIRISLCLRT